jgi:hypothetical protein
VTSVMAERLLFAASPAGVGPIEESDRVLMSRITGHILG